MFLQISNHSIDVEYIRLLHDIHADNIDGHPWRGFTILNQNCESVKRPVWFIFSALGSQWPGMGIFKIKYIFYLY